MERQTFKRHEKLKSRKEISRLFTNGNSFISEPFKVIWDFSQVENLSKYPAQIAISIPKRNFKKAVDRNFIKRQTREGYRKNKYLLYKYLTQNNLRISIIVIFLNRKKINTNILEKNIIELLKKLILEIKKQL